MDRPTSSTSQLIQRVIHLAWLVLVAQLYGRGPECRCRAGDSSERVESLVLVAILLEWSQQALTYA